MKTSLLDTSVGSSFHGEGLAFVPLLSSFLTVPHPTKNHGILAVTQVPLAWPGAGEPRFNIGILQMGASESVCRVASKRRRTLGCIPHHSAFEEDCCESLPCSNCFFLGMTQGLLQDV